jgi:signal transduction histidine kinase
MSHELQTPLTSIIAYSEILIHEGADPESSEYLLNIYQSAHHLLDLITDILDFSKIEKGKMNLHLTYFTFDEILEIMANIFNPITQQNKQKLSFAISPDLPAIMADKNKIKQVIMNLLSNAIKFTPPGGIINVEVIYLNEYELFQVSVSDTGRGIEAGKLTHIFDKFVQLDSSTTREFGGLGLGLAVTKQMVELHGGTIWARSTVNEGSTFYFTLPCIAQQNINPM